MTDSSNHGKAQSPPAPPLKDAPHTMYYQPETGYPGNGPQPPPYHPYPSRSNEYPPYHGYNNFTGHASYYDVSQNHLHTHNGRSRCIHGFVMCTSFIVTTFFIITLIIIFILQPQFPIFKVRSLCVSNFSSTSTLAGDWSISVTILNPNTRLRGYFTEFKVDVVFDDNELATSYVPKFELDKHDHKRIHVKASSSYVVNGVSFQQWDLDKMSNERQSGFIMLSVRVSSMIKFKSSNSLATRNTRTSVVCEGLKVVFQNNTGTLESGGNSVTCQHYM